MRTAENPEMVRRLAPMCVETVLADGGKPKAAIVVPESDPVLRSAAEDLQDALERRIGVRLPVVNAGDALRKWPPKRNLIAIGVLGTNPVIERLYFEYLTLMDGDFPAPDTFAIQTIHNPYGMRRNIVVLGATDSKQLRLGGWKLVSSVDVADNAARIGHIIHTSSREPHPRVATLDSRGYLTGEENDARFQQGKRPTSRAEDLVAELGGDPNNARMFWGHMTQSAVGYLLTGRAEHLKAFKLFFRAHRDLGVPGVGTHMEMWRTIAYWDLIEESPAFSDTERLEIVNHFLTMLRGPEGVMYSLYQKGLRETGVRHNHQTQPALCAFFGGRYFRRNYRLPEAEGWLEGARHLFASQAVSFKPICDAAGYQWYTLDQMATYAMASGDMTWFENGSCRRACDLAMLCTSNLGVIPGFGDSGSLDETPVPLLSAAAYYYRDGRYQQAIRGMVRPLGRGFVTDGIEDKRLEALDGVHAFPMDPQFHRMPKEVGRGASEINQTLDPGVPLAKAFDKLAFRNGTDPAGEYLLLDGITMGSHTHEDANSVLEYHALGRRLLVEMTVVEGTALKDHNAVSVLRDGEMGRLPGACSLESIAHLPNLGFSATEMTVSGAAWRRHIIWLRGRAFVVMDGLTATQAGLYRYRCHWRSLGEPTLDGDTLSVVQDDAGHRRSGSPGPEAVRLQLASADAGKPHLERESRECGRYWTDYPWADPVVNIYSRTIQGRRRAGTSDWYTTCISADPADREPHLAAHRVSESWVLLSDGPELALAGVQLSPGESHRCGKVESDARMVLVGGRRAAMVEGRTLGIGSTKLTASRPVSLEWSYAGELTVDATAKTRLRVEAGEISIELRVPAGRSEHVVPRIDDESVDAGLKSTFGRLQRRSAVIPKGRRQRRGAGVGGRGGSNSGRLTVRKLAEAGSGITSLVASDDAIAIGSSDGTVSLFGADGKPRWAHKTGGTVHSVALADVDGDEAMGVVAGSEDAGLYLFGSDGDLRWRFQGEPYVGYWHCYASACEVRRVMAADLDGDGRPEILAAIGNLNLHAISSDGEMLWKDQHYGTPTQVAVADVNGDGRPEVLAGTGDFGCNSNLHVLRPDGTLIHDLQNDGWSSTVTAVTTACFAETPVPVILVGTTKGGVHAWRADGDTPRRLWREAVGESVTAVEPVSARNERSVAAVVGSSADYVYGISADGEIRWSRHLGAQPGWIAAVPGTRNVFVGTDEGGLLSIEAGKGKVLGTAQVGGPITGALPVVGERGTRVLVTASAAAYSVEAG